jgi:hypothetical protein
MGSTAAAVMFYPIWLFIGFFGFSFILLSLQSKIKNNFGRAGLAFAVAVILTPITWCPSARLYNQYRTERAYQALDSFIVTVAETGEVPDGFQAKNQIAPLKDDISQEYTITSADDLLGVYEFVVVFSNSTQYYFAIDHYDDGWSVHFYEQ